MSRPWVKLWRQIVTSSVWVEDDATLRVWIAMLATMDSDEVVRASVPGMASLCRISIEQMRHAVSILSAPDPDSRSPTDDGRRIRAVEGGWFVINAEKYREQQTPNQVADAERQRRHRERVKTGLPPAKKATRTVAPEDPLPPSLDTPAFRLKWAEWLTYRRAAKGVPVTALAAAKQFAQLIPLGPETAARSIDLSIANDWQGLIPERLRTAAPSSQPSRHRQTAEPAIFTEGTTITTDTKEPKKPR